MSNYTNTIKKDVKLITKQRVHKPTFIIKFSKSENDWFVCWDSKIIKRYNKQTCDNIISMRPYIDEFFNKEKKQSVLDMYDSQYFLYDTLITKTYFEDNLKKVRTTKWYKLSGLTVGSRLYKQVKWSGVDLYFE